MRVVSGRTRRWFVSGPERAAEADDVYFLAAGLPLSMKPSVSEVPEMRCPR